MKVIRCRPVNQDVFQSPSAANFAHIFKLELYRDVLIDLFDNA